MSFLQLPWNFLRMRRRLPRQLCRKQTCQRKSNQLPQRPVLRSSVRQSYTNNSTPIPKTNQEGPSGNFSQWRKALLLPTDTSDTTKRSINSRSTGTKTRTLTHRRIPGQHDAFVDLFHNIAIIVMNCRCSLKLDGRSIEKIQNKYQSELFQKV